MKTTLLAAITLLALSGCKPTYDHTTISQVGSNELPATVTPQKITVSVGGVLTAHIQPYNSDNEALTGDVQSDDPGTIEVAHSTVGANFVFLGIKVGTCKLHVLADGLNEATIDAEVIDQPAQ
jgi:hypothetical protein